MGVWDKMSEIYQREIDASFTPVIDQVLKRANLQPGESVFLAPSHPDDVRVILLDELRWMQQTDYEDTQ